MRSRLPDHKVAELLDIVIECSEEDRTRAPREGYATQLAEYFSSWETVRPSCPVDNGKVDYGREAEDANDA